MSDLNLEIINPQVNNLSIENSLTDTTTNVDINFDNEIQIDIVNTEKILPSDFPDTYPFTSIIGDVPYTRVSGLTENTQDIIGSYISGVSGISVLYNDVSGFTTISLSDPIINTVDIVDFNSGVSGLLPVKNIINGTGIYITNNSGIYTVNCTLNVSSVPEAQSLVTTVFNRSQTPIPKMTVVYINGGQGDMPTVAYSIASGESGSSKTYGVTQEIIPAMGSGHVVVDGYIGGLNTDQFNPTAPQGDVNGVTLWLSPTVSGAMTTSKPYAPYHMVAVGKIIRTHQNQGIISVKIQNGYELEELHNVATTGATNGQFLQYNSSNSLWVPSSNGNFSSLQLNGNTVSVSGHTHTSSNIIDFNSSVSGLIPNNIVYTSGDQNINGNLIVSGSGTFDTLTAIGYPIENSEWGEKLAGIINANTLILDRYTAPGPQDGPAGSIQFITQAPSVVTLKPSDYDYIGGTYLFPQFGGGTLSIEGHTHLTSDITDFNSSVSGLLPITNLTAGSGIGITQSGTTFTVATTGTFGLTQSQVDARVNALTSGIYAPLSSPSFSGIPLVPTAASGTNTQQIASTAFVRTEISNLVASAPTALDTLNELATALGNDANFSTTVTNNLAGKANLSGATFTGSISGPSGNFTSLKVNNVDVSANGHTHTSSNITDFNSSVSGLLTPYQLALTNPVTGVGTSGYLTKWISGSGVSSGVIFDNGSGIGIGTTNPLSTLDVRGEIRASGLSGTQTTIWLSDNNIPAYKSIIHHGNFIQFNQNNVVAGYGVGIRLNNPSNVGIDSNGPNGYLALAAGGSEKVRIATDGKVGVGTTTPIGQLHVIGSGIFSSGIIVGDSSTNGYIYGPSGNTNIQFNNGGSNRLDLNGSNVFLNGSFNFFNGTNYCNGTLYFPKTSTPTSTATQSNPNEIRLYNGLWNGSSAYDGYNTIHSIASTSVSGANRLAFLINNGDGTQGRTERLSLLSNGFVGINTTTPSGQLHVIGTGLFSNGIGINTTSPSGFFDIKGDMYVRSSGVNGGFGKIYFPATNFGTDNSIWMGLDSNQNLTLLGGGPTLTLSPNGGNVLLRSGSTNIEIGQSYNAGTNNQFIRFVPAGTEAVRITSSGNVGIGTTSPSSKLDVNGNVNIDGNLTFDSFTESVVAIGNSSTSQTISLTSGTVQTCTLTGNCTFTMPTATAGKSFTMFLNTGTGNFTATFSGVRWADSATPTATILANKVDIYSFISDGTYWYGSFSQNYG